MEAILRKAWNLQEGLDIIEVNGNAFMFRFEKEEEYSRILRGRPWSINGCVLNLLECSRYNSVEEFDFSRCSVWIQIHNVPMEAWCLENAITLGEHVGEVVLAEDPVYKGRYLRNFLRARVILDLRKPLAYGFWLPRPDGRKIWISIRYEKLQSFCYNCGKISHDNRFCSSAQLMSIYKPNEPRFGAWLTSTACLSMDEVLTMVKDEGEETRYVQKLKDLATQRREAKNHQQGSRVPEDGTDELFSINLLRSTIVWKGEEEVKNSTPMKRVDDNSLAKDIPNPEQHNGGRDREPLDAVKATVRSILSKVKERHQEMSRSKCLKSEVIVNTEHVTPNFSKMAPPKDLEENSMALVLYNGEDYGKILGGLKGLRLKRKTDEEVVPECSERRKTSMLARNPESDISTMANYLRKTKARLKRSGRRKGKEGKENIPAEVMYEVGVMGESEADISMDSDFVFKAGGSRRRMLKAEGSGGWPSSATKTS
ncbi:hypothetical protein QN277_016597 [Acacia crassicarpa]|uniref:CCHC-type domain-containing protein n=1 Tax=Acacia crassicarpa TaxID=499986 RepID=A0AAE1MX31_9FABA|nr:hypothetical protein QN277_016597 [Acacia crassicarpa]